MGMPQQMPLLACETHSVHLVSDGPTRLPLALHQVTVAATEIPIIQSHVVAGKQEHAAKLSVFATQLK